MELLRVVAAAAQRRRGREAANVDSVAPKRVVGTASGSEKGLGLCVMYIN